MIVCGSLTLWEGKEANLNLRSQEQCLLSHSPAVVTATATPTVKLLPGQTPLHLRFQLLNQRLAQVYQISGTSSQGQTLVSHPES